MFDIRALFGVVIESYDDVSVRVPENSEMVSQPSFESALFKQRATWVVHF